MQLIGVNLERLVGGGKPQSLPISNGTHKGKNSNQERSFKCKGTGAPACASSISRGAVE